MPQRRATSVTSAPGCVASATIKHFCSSDQLRRLSPRFTPSTTSLRVLLRALTSTLAASVSVSMSASVSQRPTTRPYCRGGSLGGAATTRTVLWHVGDEVVEHAALPEQRVGAGFAGVGFQQPVHAEAFADRAQQGEQRGGEGADQQQSVAPHGLADARGGQPHAEA